MSERAPSVSRLSKTAALLSRTHYVDRAFAAFEVAREELALALCDRTDQAALTVALYRQKTRYSHDADYHARGLFAFEREALAGHFPRPPARLVVGGCGGGREVFALRQIGYEVVAAYDPAPELVVALRDRLGPIDLIALWEGSHETFEASRPPSLSCDGVVVGWGSFTHVMGSASRIAFLRSLRKVCPVGPVLLSFFAMAEVPGGGRARLRRVLRGMLARVPGVAARLGEAGDGFEPQTGFAHWFRPSEIEQEAIAAGYKVASYAGAERGYAHAVLRPLT